MPTWYPNDEQVKVSSDALRNQHLVRFRQKIRRNGSAQPLCSLWGSEWYETGFDHMDSATVKMDHVVFFEYDGYDASSTG